MLTQISLFCAVLSAAAASAQAAPGEQPAAVSGERAESVYSPSHSETAARSASLTATEQWYGWQPLLVDVLGAGLLALAVATNQPGLGVLGLGGFGLVAPMLHGRHGNWPLCGGQFLLRLLASGLAGMGLVIRALTADRSGTGEAILVTGALVGGISIVLDIVLGYEEVRPTPPKPYAVTPWADPRGNAGLQLTAAF